MQYNKQLEQPFNSPGRIWKNLIYWFFGIFLTLTVFGFVCLFTQQNPSAQFKTFLILTVIVLYISTQLFLWYRYKAWSSKKKNELISFLMKDKSLIYSKYNRFFLNIDRLISYTVNPESFNKLRQKDLKEVAEFWD